jgi:hypothetical protein
LSYTEIILVHDGTDQKLRKKVVTLTSNSTVAQSTLVISTRRNPGGSRNLGLEKANGQWIHFCDFDDKPILPAMITTIRSATDKTSLIVGQFRKIDYVSNLVIQTSRDYSIAKLIREIGLWRCIFRLDAIKQCKFPDSRMGEDQVFFLSTNPVKQKIFFSDKIFYEYFVSDPNQLTAVNSNIQELFKSIESSMSIKINGEGESKIFFEVVARLMITLLYKSRFAEPLRLIALARRAWKCPTYLSPWAKVSIALRILGSIVKKKMY